MTAYFWRRKWKAVLPVAVVCTIVFACQDHARAATGGTAPVFSATQLADGVLFDNGPAAPYLASLNRPVPPQSSALTTIENATNTAINANPQLAASLQAEFQSGDPNQVQDALAQLGNVSVPIFDGLYGSQTVSKMVALLVSQINQGDLAQGIGFGAELDNYAGDWVWTDNAVAAYNFVFAANVAVVLVVVAWQPSGPADNTLSMVQQILVANIATNLQAAD